MNASDDPRVQAVRNSIVVGRTTCEMIAECWSDEEVLEHVKELRIRSPHQAVLAMCRVCDEWYDRALTCEAPWARDSRKAFRKRWTQYIKDWRAAK